MASRRPDFKRLLAGITRELRRRGIPFMHIGGQAVLLHGAPRLTQDIDVTLALGPDDMATVAAVCDALELDPLVEDLARFARETFVCPLRDRATGIRVDLIFSTTPYERVAIARAVEVDIGGESVPFASAEDLILLKLFAGRERDLEDARSVVDRQGARLDWRHLEHWAAAFAAIPGREELPARLQALRQDDGDSSACCHPS